MKTAKPRFNSFKKKIVKKSKEDYLKQNTRHGETLIPVGDEDARVVLQRAEATYTYDVIKTEEMTSNLKVSCGDTGFLTGLLLNTEGGVLSIDPITAGTRTLSLNPSLSNGSWVSLLSEGNNWFCWGWTGGDDLVSVQSEAYIPLKPTQADPDGDGLSGQQETAEGSDPLVADSDGDGVDDGVEVVSGTSPTDETDTPDINQDSDGDTFTDTQEVEAGTDPFNAASYPGANEANLPDPSEIGPVFTGIPNTLTIEAGTAELDAKVEALDGVTATDNVDGSVPISITFSGYTGTHGETFTATYSATDSDANTTQVVKTFNVEDTIAPVITLVGDNPLTVALGSVGTDPGATTDDGSPITSSWDSTITDETVVGTYDVVYNSTDAAGNAATPVTRSVVIEEDLDVTPPVITIQAEEPYLFIVGNAGPTAPPATADDGSPVTNDWDEAALNLLTDGQTSTITYSATDESANTGTATLQVQAVAYHWAAQNLRLFEDEPGVRLHDLDEGLVPYHDHSLSENGLIHEGALNGNADMALFWKKIPTSTMSVGDTSEVVFKRLHNSSDKINYFGLMQYGEFSDFFYNTLGGTTGDATAWGGFNEVNYAKRAFSVALSLGKDATTEGGVDKVFSYLGDLNLSSVATEYQTSAVANYDNQMKWIVRKDIDGTFYVDLQVDSGTGFASYLNSEVPLGALVEDLSVVFVRERNSNTFLDGSYRNLVLIGDTTLS